MIRNNYYFIIGKIIREKINKKLWVVNVPDMLSTESTINLNRRGGRGSDVDYCRLDSSETNKKKLGSEFPND